LQPSRRRIFLGPPSVLAFDSIVHEDLLLKLFYYVVRGPQLNFFRSCLSNSSQFVCTELENSSVESICYGVPQGSILGPLLFFVAINFLPPNINARCFMWLRHTFLNSESDIRVLRAVADEELVSAIEWCMVSGLLLNNFKTQILIFGLRQFISECPSLEFDHVKFFEIFVDRWLTWSPQIYYISSKLSSVVFLLRQLINYTPLDCEKKTVYFA
jgi:hypothetical protein